MLLMVSVNLFIIKLYGRDNSGNVNVQSYCTILYIPIVLNIPNPHIPYLR
jgi:hypothetical protein